MLAKMPQKTVKSPFRNKLTILSLVLLMGIGLSAAYFIVPFLQVPVPTPDNLIGNTTNNTVSAPVTQIGSSEIQTPAANTTTNTTSTNVNNQNNTGNQNTSKTSTATNSKTSSSSKTTTSKSNTNSKTNPSSTNTKKTTNSTG